MTRLLLALAVLLSPAAAMAQCSPEADRTEAMSCAEGFAWDPVTGTCAPVVTG